MTTINRRELNHKLSQVLDHVLNTGESVEVTTRGGPPLLISLKPESLYESWVRQDLVNSRPADRDVLASIGIVELSSTTEEILADLRGER